MALQAIDRQKAKHAIKVARRFQPPMINRSNKRVRRDHTAVPGGFPVYQKWFCPFGDAYFI